MLSELPTIPPEHVLVKLQAVFHDSFEHHIFLKSVCIANLTVGHTPPYLELALACLGCLSASVMALTEADMRPAPAISDELFDSGVSLWSVMLEVDNRESRSCAATIAVGFHPSFDTITRTLKLTVPRELYLPRMEFYQQTKRPGKGHRDFCALWPLYDLSQFPKLRKIC